MCRPAVPAVEQPPVDLKTSAGSCTAVLVSPAGGIGRGARRGTGHPLLFHAGFNKIPINKGAITMYRHQFQSAQHVIDEVRNMNVKGGSRSGAPPHGPTASPAPRRNSRTWPRSGNGSTIFRASCSASSPRWPPSITPSPSSIKSSTPSPPARRFPTITGEIAALCQRIIQYSLSAVDHLGENGANLIQDGCTVMMPQLFERPDERPLPRPPSRGNGSA